MYGHVKMIINSNMQEIHKANLEICALQEVRRFKQGSTTIECGNSKYEIHWSGQSLKRQHPQETTWSWLRRQSRP